MATNAQRVQVMERAAQDDFLSRQEIALGPAPDGALVLRVYMDDTGLVPFGRVRDVGCQVVYERNDQFWPVGYVPPRRNPDFRCELRGMKER